MKLNATVRRADYKIGQPDDDRTTPAAEDA
jgi:hypothetical protein